MQPRPISVRGLRPSLVSRLAGLPLLAALLALSAHPASATTTITSSTTIANSITDDVDVSGSGTVVTIGPPGSITGRLTVESGATVNIAGGSVTGDLISVNGTLNISGGTVGAQIADRGTVIISGGSVSPNVSPGIYIQGGTVTITGGSVSNSGSAVDAEYDATVSVSGGSVDDIVLEGDSTLTITGGLLSGSIHVGDGNTASISGTCLQLAADGTLTGNLQDGSPINMPTSGLTASNLITSCPPSLTGCTDITVGADPGQCSALVAFNAVASGDPAPTVVYSLPGGTAITSPHTFPVGTTTVTATASSSAGTGTCAIHVTVKDTERPTITAPAAVMVNTDPGQCTASHVNLGTPTTGDNCPGAQVTNNAPTAFLKGVTTVTWTVTDASGNQATATQTVTVKDTEKPVLTTPPSVTVNAAAGQCGASVSAKATATDNCPGVSVSGSRSDGQALTAAYPLGVTSLLWTATDASGNQSTGTQTITVKQADQPVMADMFASAIGSTPVHQDQAFIAKVGQCVTLTFRVTFRGGETCDVTQSPDTAFTTNPARGNWTSKNVWCPGPADADKTITLYGLYRNASGATINDTVIVHVSR